MKKRITEEMKAAAEARREKFGVLCRRVAEMSEAERAGLLERVGAVMSCEGRALSETNTVLLVLQRPGVSVVGGFRQWKKAGRYVRKGEKSCSIWIPRGGGDTPALAGSELSRAELVEGGGSGAGGSRRKFLTGAVFDIGQTEAVGAGGPAADEDEGGAAESAGVLAVAAPVAPAAPLVAPLVVLPPVAVAAPAALPVRTIWDSPGGSGGPLLICAPPPRAPAAVVAAPAVLSALDVPPFPPGPGERAQGSVLI